MAILAHSRNEAPSVIGLECWAALVRLAVVIAALAAIALRAAPTALDENETKAAAFYNVLAFTTWPSEAFAAPDAPLVVAIVGHGPVAALLDKIIEGEMWRDRKIAVEHYDSGDQVKTCHVLFVARSEHGNWARLRSQFANRPVLAVSDAPDFAAQGGNVQLAIDHSRLRIFVNLATTRANSLQLSSNLLHLATIIGPVPDPLTTPRSEFRLSPLGERLVCLAQLD